MTKKIIVQLGRKHKKIAPRSEKERLAREANRERINNDSRFGKGWKTADGSKVNGAGNNQHTSPKGHKLISEATNVYINEVAPDEICAEVHLPSGSTWADIIAMRQIVIAAGGSLASTQFAMDVTEDKLKGPGGSNAGHQPIFNPITFLEPKKQ